MSNDGNLDDISLFEEEEFEKDARRRSHENKCFRCLFLMVTSVSFNFFIFCLILLNTITLAIYTYDQSDTQTFVIAIFNEFFVWAFFLEMILKLVGLGFKNYIRDSYNLFDAVIVIISLVDWAISRSDSIDAGSTLKAFKAFRLLRMMKLSKSWKALQDILSQTVASLRDLSSFSLLLGLFMFIFALLGMETFANIAILNEEEELILGEENV